MLRNKTRCNSSNEDDSELLQPIQKPITNTFWFDEPFEKESIEDLIQGINMSISLGNTCLTVYFSSEGGYINCLTVLSDFLNNLPEDVYIDFIVNGGVCSAGFYILLMIDNPNINIIFDKLSSWGMIHLADSWNSQRGVMSKEDERYNYHKFNKKELERLNTKLKEDYIDKLSLSIKDRKKIDEGEDVYLPYEELERLINDFHDRKFYTSENFMSYYSEIKAKKTEYELTLQELELKYKKYNGKDIDKELELNDKGSDI